MTETPSVPEAVNAEIDKRTEAIAATAAAQIDQANKDAEAIARAAQQSEHVARVNELEGKVATWKSDLENRLTAQKEELTAMIAASLSLIPPPSPPPAPPVIVETPDLGSSPTVNPASEGEEPKSKSKPTEPPAVTPPAPPRQEARKRAVL